MATHNYHYIRAYGKFMGSHGAYIEQEIRRAKQIDAPVDAIYERRGAGGQRTGEWARFTEQSPPRQREIAEHLSQGVHPLVS